VYFEVINGTKYQEKTLIRKKSLVKQSLMVIQNLLNKMY